MTLGPLDKFPSALRWKGKYVESANLSERRPGLRAGACLSALLSHPAGATLTSLEIVTLAPGPVVKALAKAPPTLRILRFFSPMEVAPLRGLGPVLSRLNRLVLDGKFELAEPLDLPVADELAIEIDALSETSAGCIVNGSYPLVQGLTIGLVATSGTRDKLAGLFAKPLPKLDFLVISDAAELDDVCEMLVAAPFAPQLTGLQLGGRLTERGVDALATSDRLRGLKTLDVPPDLDARLLARLKKRVRKVERYDPSME
jgi:hypothetical protein